MVNSERQSDSVERESDRAFTVFTPTYNRAHTLHRAYESLKNQSDRDFEWLIVDDGSTDNTRELVEQWQKEADFPIRYFYQTNSGKHIAYNLAAKEARGQFFICLDSDDSCVPETLERLKYHWETIPPEERDRFVGIDCLCQDPEGNLIGSNFPFNPTDATSLDIRYRYKVTGEKWGFQRTDVLRKFPFPEEIKNTYVPENVVWSSIAKHYKIRSVNECLRIYYIDSGGDQISKFRWLSRALPGINLMYRSMLEKELDYFRYKPLGFLRTAIKYSRSSFLLKTDIKTQFVNVNSQARWLLLVAIPIGYLLFLKDLMNGYLLKKQT